MRMARVIALWFLLAAVCLYHVQVKRVADMLTCVLVHQELVTSPASPLMFRANLRCCTLQAQKHLNEALQQNNHALFTKIVECAGAKDAFSGTKGKVTVLAPTDGVSC
jgi:hypothetical protein